jgi:hypothetical protein
MIRRNTWITLGVFALVLVAAILVRQRQQAEPPPTPSASLEPLWQVESSEIVGLTVEDLQAGTVLQLERDPEDLWQIVLPETLPADPARVERAVAWLSAPTPRAEVLDAIDLTAFELVRPQFRVEIVLSNGERHEFSVGRPAPTGDSRYASSPGRPGVQILSLVGLEEVLNLAIDLLPTPTPTMTPSPSPEPGATITPTQGIGGEGTPEP